MAVEATSAGSPEGAGARPGWLHPDALVKFAGLAGAIAFVVLYAASRAFYTPLGATPSDVGLGYGNLLAQSAMAVAVTALGSAALWLGYGALGAAVLSAAWRRALELIALAAMVVGSATAVAVDWRAGYLAAEVVTLALIVFGAVGFVRARRLHVAPGARLRATVAGEGARTGAILGVSLVVVGLFSNAAQDSEAVREGRARYTNTGLNGPWDARPAHVLNAPASAAVGRSDCVYYLGTSDGAAVLYDARGEGRLIRVPAGSTAVEVIDPPKRCGS